jgi:hypothetical protein
MRQIRFLTNVPNWYITILLLLVCAPAKAAPFLISNPDPAGIATVCAYQDGTVITRTPTVAFACHADLTATTVGTHTLTVWFEAPAWGQVSVSTPFTFGRPSSTGAGPTGIGISAN